MQHNHDVALLDAQNRLIVLGFGRNATEFRMDRTTYELTRLQRPEPDRAGRVAAVFQTASELYYSDHWFPAFSTDPRSHGAGLPGTSRSR
ncbi:MAG TPA: hypothetical protein EYP14_13195 [Planctomycetaceae bacterium]|nr:hypothetical protein [Planctomycetaceae bacterium]